MFKGIITDIGIIVDTKICSNSDWIFYIKTKSLSPIYKGDSISCSGICLTVIDVINDIFITQISKSTVKITNLNNCWKIGEKINLEQAIKMSDRIDGHLIQGHIDETVQILTINQSSDSHEIKLSCPRKLIKFIAEKGSVALDGVSLTINSVINYEFTVNIIPYTWQNTTFQYKKINDYLNLEVDMISKYLNQLICQ
ncbi:MAG: riboflavin synthase [Wolbachia endosymbiont of Menacanthus eurysternus]|nr:MAG: riboflavin synthase [Wolbachia endosymbiont of Menacanthus eurysternus]